MNSPYPPALAHWHSIMQERNVAGLAHLLADEVVFHSPVVAKPQVGKPITSAYLSAAMQVFGNETFKYVREIVQSDGAVLEFELEIDGIHINGIDMLRWNTNHQLTEFKVMLRPLKAINIIHQKMGEMLAKTA
jgi:hypothetical protein